MYSLQLHMRHRLRTRIKVCGITRTEDVQVAAALGVDALGFVFYPPSPRALSMAKAQVLLQATPAFISSVALFLNPTKAEVDEVIDVLQPDLLQFHGTESAEFCAQFGRPYLCLLYTSPSPRD